MEPLLTVQVAESLRTDDAVCRITSGTLPFQETSAEEPCDHNYERCGRTKSLTAKLTAVVVIPGWGIERSNHD